MADSLEQLLIDAKDIRARGMAPDRIVLRAIGLGCDTRKAIKEATGLDYGSIEKALERESLTVHKSTKGMIERLTLASQNGSSAPKAPFNPAFSPKKPPTNESILTCESCGKPRSPGSGKQCRDCYQGKKKTFTPEDRVRAGEMCAQGKSMYEIASAFGMKTSTFDLRRRQDPLLEEAIQRGRDVYMEAGEAESEDEPVAYIDEPEAPAAAPMKIELTEDDRAPVLTKPEIRERIAKMLHIEAVDSPVLTDALIEAEQAITAHVLANQPPPALLDLTRLPSALIKEIRDDDAFFANAYDTLIGILSDDMEDNEKAAIWTLILYLKSLDAQRWEFRKP